MLFLGFSPKAKPAIYMLLPKSQINLNFPLQNMSLPALFMEKQGCEPASAPPRARYPGWLLVTPHLSLLPSLPELAPGCSWRRPRCSGRATWPRPSSRRRPRWPDSCCCRHRRRRLISGRTCREGRHCAEGFLSVVGGGRGFNDSEHKGKVDRSGTIL